MRRTGALGGLLVALLGGFAVIGGLSNDNTTPETPAAPVVYNIHNDRDRHPDGCR